MKNIVIHGACEGNLQNVTVEIPRERLVVFTGLSGSGKSTLLSDVLMVECQRQYLEALGMEGIRKPAVEYVKNASPAVMISQKDVNRNPRSTVGTLTDIYTDLRMLYEKLGKRRCPFCGETIAASECREETEKNGDDYQVSMYCSSCGRKMDKLTITDFSFNTREGACRTCAGLGRVLSVDRKRAVQEALSPEDGAVDFLEGKYREYQTENLYRAFRHFGLPVCLGKPVKEYTEGEKAILYEGVNGETVKKLFPGIPVPETVEQGKFEGVIPWLFRRIAEKNGDSKRLNRYFEFSLCPDCGGERLGSSSRSVTVAGRRLPELTILSLEEIGAWTAELEGKLTETEKRLVGDYTADIRAKVERIVRVGLDYLSLDRQTVTLSGGELQRLRLAAALSCDLTGMIYLLDEPTAGLHPRDTAGLISILKNLRDLGNTVLVIEHDPDVMRQADLIIDMGPGAGKNGGRIVGRGTLEELKKQKDSVTGAYLSKPRPTAPAAGGCRKGSGETFRVRDAHTFHLKHIDVDFPVGCLTAVVGVSGSGKSTLVFEELAKKVREENKVPVVAIEQHALTRMKRSNLATFMELYGEIRRLLAATEEAKRKGLSEKHFSFNVKGGRCENCEGLGFVTSRMLFFEDREVVCPVCKGKQFSENILSVTFLGLSVHEILKLSVEEACVVFRDNRKLREKLRLLMDVGLSYPELGQTLPTLSGGEGQRLKLARELAHASKGKHRLYLLDEPTVGLHPYDVEHFMLLLRRLVDAGNTVVVAEHNEQFIRSCDRVIELGPGGGKKGGRLLRTGTPADFPEYR